jgi:hypothetical protein
MSEKSITIPLQGANGAFANLLAGMKRGAVLGDLDDTLKEVVSAINATGKAGSITLKLKIVPEGKADSESPIYAITEDISVKKPRKSRGVAKFFGDEDGNLMRNDPKQQEIKFGAIDGGQSDVKPPVAAPAAAAAQ